MKIWGSIIILLLAGKPVTAQNSVTFVNSCTGERADGIKLSIYERVTQTMPDGLPYLLPPERSALREEAVTDPSGVWSSTETLSGLTAIRINDDRFANQWITLWDRNKEYTVFVDPLNCPESQHRKAEHISDSLKAELERQKMADPAIPEYEETERGTEAACAFSVPEKVYVKNLFNGYNNTSCSNAGTFTGYINFDEYIAGCITREMGSSFQTEALKAQAIAARTYSLKRHLAGKPVNCGQSYTSSVPAKCMDASRATSGIVILYNDQPIDASYAARCSGTYTQNSHEGLWNTGVNCNRSGSAVPYLKSKPCSGHSNCSGLGETPCCNTIVSTSGLSGFIYGHGVGMCQRGANAFASSPHNYSFDKILLQYYTGVCLANAAPAGLETGPSDEGDIRIMAGEGMIKVMNTNTEPGELVLYDIHGKQAGLLNITKSQTEQVFSTNFAKVPGWYFIGYKGRGSMKPKKIFLYE